MLKRLLCWHKWGKWAYSRTHSHEKRGHYDRKTCRKCGHVKYRKERQCAF